MEGGDLSRRKVIAAIGAAGSTGLFLGTGSGSVFADEESFLDNIFAAGSLDMAVTWEVDGETRSSEGDASFAIELSRDDRSGSEAFTVTLPDDGSNNAAYGWLRMTCPAPTDLNDALRLTLRYDCGDEGVIQAGTLLEVADALRDGVALDAGCNTFVQPGSQRCLQPGDTIDLRLEWALDDDYTGKAETSLSLEFAGRQCRNQDGTTNPFPAVEPCEGDEGQAISWVAFCAVEGTTLSDDELSFTVDGDTLVLESAPAEKLAAVVLKYGSEIRVFDDPGTSGTFTTTSGGTVYQRSGNTYGETDRTDREPCPGTCGLKYEAGSGFQEPLRRGCSS